MKNKTSFELLSMKAGELLLWCQDLQVDRDALKAENAALKEQLETERMRLTACSTAALGYFNGCKDEYKSASLDDVLRLREQLTAAQKDAERYHFVRCKEEKKLRYFLWGFRDFTPQERDAAIDAAIAKEKQE